MMSSLFMLLLCLVVKGHSFLNSATTTSIIRPAFAQKAATLAMSTTASTTVALPSWSDLQKASGQTAVGKALNTEVEARQKGDGSAHVQNKLRKFGKDKAPQITLFRDHAGWCPYCQKTMLLIEEKEIPIKIDLVPMRSYGDKPREFLQKVPNGLLPAIEVNGQVITESQVIMELLDEWHTVADGYKPMMPPEDDYEARSRYDMLARLERELFSWWCTLIFRPEGPLGSGGGGILGNLLGGGDPAMSGSMKGFLECIQKVDRQLLETDGPWFFGEDDFPTGNYPTMIDFIYVSHVERMLASCAYWKGLDLRDPKWNLKGLNRWLEAFEKREAYLAFKSDYFTHVKDIPPQYGPGYHGGFEDDQKAFSKSILGRDSSWRLPLSHDDPLQPLYNGPPLPLCVLEAVGLKADADGSYQNSAAEKSMEIACRSMAAWKLASNGINVSRFAARGGPKGAQNPRKTFGAELADPYAEPDNDVRPAVDAALRVVCSALMDESSSSPPPESFEASLKEAVPSDQIDGVVSSLAYMRDRVGVPRDLPLAAARYLRAYLNWGIDTLSSSK